MTRKKSEPKAAKPKDLTPKAAPDESRKNLLARAAINPCATAAIVSVEYSKALGELDIASTWVALQDKADCVLGGSMGEIESTLVAQASALNSMFTGLARRAHAQEFLNNFEVFAKLALRAQNQCRMTLETLATIKNPPVVFAKQANIANNQQVNNGEAVPVAGAGGTGRPQPEQSRLTHERQSLDFGTPAQAGRGDPAMATVEAIDRAAYESGQGKV